MDPIELDIVIDKPREEVFAYLADIANHAEFCDHYLKEWRLTRIDSVGPGAGARFRVAAPLRRFEWADLSFAALDAPRQIVAFGRGGKFNRNKTTAEWLLEPVGAGSTRVTWRFESEPALPTDKVNDALGLRGWTKRRAKRALRRLRAILEDGEQRGARPTVAGL